MSRWSARLNRILFAALLLVFLALPETCRSEPFDGEILLAQALPTDTELDDDEDLQPPVADAGPDQLVEPGRNTGLDGSASLDPDGDIDEWLWSQTAGPSVELRNADKSKAGFTAPSVTEKTDLLFSLTVTDDDGLTGTDEVLVTVSVPAQPPVADAGSDLRANESTLVELDGSHSVDPDGSVVRFEWKQTDGPAVSISGIQEAVATIVTPEVDAETVLSFQLTATDDDGLSDTDSVNVTVTDVRLAPVADAGSDFQAQESTLAQLDGSNSSDPDGSIVRFEWKQTDGPAVSISEADAAVATIATPEVDDETDLSFQLTVTDDDGLTDADAVTVTVTHVSRPPVADAGSNKNVLVNQEVTLDGSASHDDGDIVSWRWAQTLGPEVVLRDDRTPTAVFTSPGASLAPTELEFRLEVVDDEGLKGMDSVRISVNRDPDAAPPLADAGPDLEVGESVLVVLDGSNSLAGAEAIETWQWSQTGGPEVRLAGADSSRAFFTAPEVEAEGAILSFRLLLTDAGGKTASDEVDVRVTSAPPFPGETGDPVVRDSVVSDQGSGGCSAGGGTSIWLTGLALLFPTVRRLLRFARRSTNR